MKVWNKMQTHFLPTPDNAYRPRVLGKTSLIFFLGIILAVEGFLVAGLAARESDGSFLSAVIASDIIDFTNTQRHAQDLGTLHENTELDAAAQAKATDMALRGYFAHISPDGTTPWVWIKAQGYVYKYAGENLAVRFFESKDVVNAWMASPTHRANILKPVYTEIGVGIATGLYQNQPATYVVQYFGSPKNVQVATVQNPAAVIVSGWAQSMTHMIARSFMKFLTEPERVNWLLGGIAAALFLFVIFAFVFHIEVQAPDMLLGGVVVAVIALIFLGTNRYVLQTEPKAATVIYMMDNMGFVDADK